MLSISNIYGHGFERRQLADWEALGFVRRPESSTYAGSQICHFVDFARGPALELIEVADHADYRAFVPAGMVPYCPGISLLLDQTSPSLDDYARDWRHLDPYILHINYDGDPDASGPGWNYLNFAIPIVPDTFTWLTALDEPKPAEPHVTAHPNGVTGVVGMVFDLDPDALGDLARLAGAAVCGGVFDIAGVRVWPRCALSDFPAPGAKGFPLVAIVLGAPSLDPLGGRAVACTFEAASALWIETNPQSWDLIVVENDPLP